MSSLVVVGAQWGDEAKGKIVDWLAEDAQYVVRYSGGNNAGHTVIVGDKKFKFQLLPSGILRRDCTSILGSGMVICPSGLLGELADTRALHGGTIGRLLISASAHVVFPYHRLLDRLEEQARGDFKIGTTSRGIGPCYQDKAARVGIRMGEFVDPSRFEPRLRDVLAAKNQMLGLFGEPPIEFEALFEEYSGYANQLREFVCEPEWELCDAIQNGKRVLFEGAQGTFLDLDLGTYPFVTSSHPIAGGACLGTGVGPRAIDKVVGVCKAYTTRVGTGPFPTELHDDIGELIREKGQEFGTVTGRGRRCGWLDLVALRQACRINSMSGLVVSRLDILSDFDEVKICSGYQLDGADLPYVPSDVLTFEKVKPVLETMPGWSGDLTGMRKWEELPHECQNYLRKIEEFCGVPVVVVSLGPERSQTILRYPEEIWSKAAQLVN